MKKENNKANTKKILSIIAISVLISVFVGITGLLLFEKIPNLIYDKTVNTIWEQKGKNEKFYNEAIELGEVFQSTWTEIETNINEIKEKESENYPATGLVLARIVSGLKNDTIMIFTYCISFGIGIIIGIISSIIYIKKSRK